MSSTSDLETNVGATLSRGSAFSFSEVGYTLPDGTVVLQGVSGSVRAGTMLAVMGPSGAGEFYVVHVGDGHRFGR